MRVNAHSAWKYGVSAQADTPSTSKNNSEDGGRGPRSANKGPACQSGPDSARNSSNKGKSAPSNPAPPRRRYTSFAKGSANWRSPAYSQGAAPSIDKGLSRLGSPILLHSRGCQNLAAPSFSTQGAAKSWQRLLPHKKPAPISRSRHLYAMRQIGSRLLANEFAVTRRTDRLALIRSLRLPAGQIASTRKSDRDYSPSWKRRKEPILMEPPRVLATPATY